MELSNASVFFVIFGRFTRRTYSHKRKKLNMSMLRVSCIAKCLPAKRLIALRVIRIANFETVDTFTRSELEDSGDQMMAEASRFFSTSRTLSQKFPKEFRSNASSCYLC